MLTWGMIEKFHSDSGFNLTVAQPQQYDEELQFTENNCMTFLAELEEFMTQLITFMAHREKNPDAPISALGLENITEKEFDKGPLAIDAPNLNDVGVIDDEITTEDELVTDPRVLFARFAEQAKKGHI